ncbi:uncharacterized protein RCC_12184 [Ramularia collo-cygni]|uniref:Major facilitator superfamily (MFS) profile domain-containing protein n=1 Tax=Ramularia collo-cygni TaxID=112498 RepID=A0A2D3UWP5_9PEZI|nr:uncharacterized protein RCC_12184 [Ramularia collo-cygni]CZT14494.1 uncharacterized protein RCC_12184 [Ramularia collo-cygni]
MNTKVPEAEVGPVEKGSFNGKQEDVAAKFLSQIHPSITHEPVTPEEDRKLLWKIDLIIVPLLSITLILAAVDKVIIANAAIYGMKEDTRLTGNDYSWVGSIFYFGYLLFEFPAAYLTQRLPVAKFLVGNVVAWGVLMLCTGATSNFAGLATCRFIMGMAEVPAFPVSSIITAMWWKRSEQPIRVAFWLNQGSSIFAGSISYGIGHTHTSVAPWRLLFLVLGAFSILWAVVLYFFLPDSPVSCWYLSEREKYVCLRRVQGNNTGMEDKVFKWYQVRECLVDPKTWLLALFAVAQNIPNGGLVNFPRCGTSDSNSLMLPGHFQLHHCFGSWIQQADYNRVSEHRSHRCQNGHLTTR